MPLNLKEGKSFVPPVERPKTVKGNADHQALGFPGFPQNYFDEPSPTEQALNELEEAAMRGDVGTGLYDLRNPQR